MNTTGVIAEEAALAWMEARGYVTQHGPYIAVGMLGAERSDPIYRDLVPKTLISGDLWVVNADQFLREAV